VTDVSVSPVTGLFPVRVTAGPHNPRVVTPEPTHTHTMPSPHGQYVPLSVAAEDFVRILDACGLLAAVRARIPAIRRSPAMTPRRRWILRILRHGGIVAARDRELPPPRPVAPVKAEPADPDPDGPLGCCTHCAHVDPDAPTHSDAGEKDRERGGVTEAIAAAVDRGGATPERPLNALVMDAPLAGRLYTAELRDAGLLDRVRVYAPNLNGDVVRALHALPGVQPGRLVAREGCVCRVLRVHEAEIAASGGLGALFLDVLSASGMRCIYVGTRPSP
jgi:hypothetical protein